ncbi:MAG: TrmH family RNA methyltransferase [Gemmatimonadota bacterium]
MSSRSVGKLLRSLRARKGRAEHGLFLAEGPHLLRELLASGRPIVRVLYTRAVAVDPEAAGLLDRCVGAGVPCGEVSEAELGDYADTITPQGILAVAEIPRWCWAHVTTPRLLVLDAVQDPGNLGTLVRTAEGMGLGGVVVLPGTADPWSPKVARAAAGSTLRIPILAGDWEEVAEELRAREVVTWAAEATGQPYRRGDAAPSRLALALGNEGAGISAAVLRDAARRVGVPLGGRLESLNVAAAGAILMDRIFGGEVAAD